MVAVYIASRIVWSLVVFYRSDLPKEGPLWYLNDIINFSAISVDLPGLVRIIVHKTWHL